MTNKKFERGFRLGVLITAEVSQSKTYFFRGQPRDNYCYKRLKQVVFSCKETHHLFHASAREQTTRLLYFVVFCLARNNLKRKAKNGNTDNTERILKGKTRYSY